MRELVYDSWNGVMNMNVNPLRHIPDTNTRHMVLQVLAWMWCMVFSFYVGSIWVFGVSAIDIAKLGYIPDKNFIILVGFFMITLPLTLVFGKLCIDQICE